MAPLRTETRYLWLSSGLPGPLPGRGRTKTKRIPGPSALGEPEGLDDGGSHPVGCARRGGVPPRLPADRRVRRRSRPGPTADGRRDLVRHAPERPRPRAGRLPDPDPVLVRVRPGDWAHADCDVAAVRRPDEILLSQLDGRPDVAPPAVRFRRPQDLHP